MQYKHLEFIFIINNLFYLLLLHFEWVWVCVCLQKIIRIRALCIIIITDRKVIVLHITEICEIINFKITMLKLMVPFIFRRFRITASRSEKRVNFATMSPGCLSPGFPTRWTRSNDGLRFRWSRRMLHSFSYHFSQVSPGASVTPVRRRLLRRDWSSR